jgi:hypothetical protein
MCTYACCVCARTLAACVHTRLLRVCTRAPILVAGKRVQMCVCVCVRACVRVPRYFLQASTHTHTRAHIRTRARAHTHTHTHTHAPRPCPSSSSTHELTSAWHCSPGYWSDSHQHPNYTSTSRSERAHCTGGGGGRGGRERRWKERGCLGKKGEMKRGQV